MTVNLHDLVHDLQSNVYNKQWHVNMLDILKCTISHLNHSSVFSNLFNYRTSYCTFDIDENSQFINHW